MPRSAPASCPARATAGARRHRARRPDRDAGLEYLAPSGGLVRHRRGSWWLITRSTAVVSRPDRLDRQSRRRPRDAGRPDPSSLLEKLADKLPTIERYVVLTDAAHVPRTSLRNAVPYEEWIVGSDGDFAGRGSTKIPPPACATPRARPETRRARRIPLLERVARADGGHLRHERVFVARRGDAGRAYVPCQLLGDGVRRSDRRRLRSECRGAKLDGASVFELLDRYKVTCTAAVPTVWLMLLQHSEATGSPTCGRSSLAGPHVRGDRRRPSRTSTMWR